MKNYEIRGHVNIDYYNYRNLKGCLPEEEFKSVCGDLLDASPVGGEMEFICRKLCEDHGFTMSDSSQEDVDYILFEFY